MTDRFRSAALALRSHISDTYALLAAADSVVDLIEQEVAAATAVQPDPIPHWMLVRMARDNFDVMEAVRQGKKINAIKALRALGINPSSTGTSLIGLKAAKEAVESQEVMADFNLYAQDPWSEPAF